MNRLFLVRHGENIANITKEFSHRKVDYPLTDKGRLQSLQTAEYFRNIPIDRLIASPLLRARQTADAIAQAKGLPVQMIESFREVNVGALEDASPTPENWRRYFDVVYPWLDGNLSTSFPDGEDGHTLIQRFYLGIQEATLGLTDKNIVVVGHGGIFIHGVAALCHIADQRAFAEETNNNCSVSEILVDADSTGMLRGELVRWADASHLSGEASQFVSPMPECSP